MLYAFDFIPHKHSGGNKKELDKEINLQQYSSDMHSHKCIRILKKLKVFKN